MAGSSGDHADAVTLTDPAPLGAAGSSVDLAEVGFDAAWDGDQQQPGSRTRRPEPVRAAPGQEDKAARCVVEGVAAAADGQFAVQDVEALIFAVVDMQRRPGADTGLKDTQSSACRMPRCLQARIVREGSDQRSVAAQMSVHELRVSGDHEASMSREEGIRRLKSSGFRRLLLF